VALEAGAGAPRGTRPAAFWSATDAVSRAVRTIVNSTTFPRAWRLHLYGCEAKKRESTAVLSEIPHSQCCGRVPNRPLRGRRGPLKTFLQWLECGILERTAVVFLYNLHRITKRNNIVQQIQEHIEPRTQRLRPLDLSMVVPSKAGETPVQPIAVWAIQKQRSASSLRLDSPLFGATTMCRDVELTTTTLQEMYPENARSWTLQSFSQKMTALQLSQNASAGTPSCPLGTVVRVLSLRCFLNFGPLRQDPGPDSDVI